MQCSEEWNLLQVLCTVHTKICWWVIFGLHVEKAFSGAQCYANGRQYLYKHAKKEYHLTAVIKCEQFLNSLSMGTVFDCMNSATQQLFK